VLVEASLFDTVNADAGALASGHLVSVGEPELADVVGSLVS
jgi:hypothetical protein